VLIHPVASGQTAITYGQTVQGMISAKGQVQQYTFTGQAGDRIVLRVNRLTGFQPRIQITKPDGSVGITQDTWSDNGGYYRAWIDEYVLPSTGIYTIFISDNNGVETGQYNLTLQRSNDPAKVRTDAFGDTRLDTVSLPSEIRVFQFIGQAGNRVVLRVNRFAGFQPRIQLYKPDGSIGVTQDPWSDNGAYNRAWIDEYILPSTGTYTIFISDNNGIETGQYNLTLQRSNNPANIRTVAYGDTRRDTISRITEIRVFQFAGQAGDRVVLHVNRLAGFQPRIQIYAPDGSIDTTRDPENDNGAFNRAWIDGHILSSTGTYTIFISDNNGFEYGTYVFTLQRSNGPANVRMIAYGDTRSDSISYASEIRVFQFAGQEGDRVVLHVNRLIGFQPRIQIYTPDGSIGITQDPATDNGAYNRAWIDAYRLPSTGTYTVFVADNNGFESGLYLLTLQRSNGPVNALALQSGDTTVDRILLPTQMRGYAIPAREGDTLWAWVQRDSGSISPLLNVYLTDGSSWRASVGSTSLLINAHIVPATGMLWMLLGDDNGVETGRYRISARISPHTGDIVYGQTIRDSITNGSRIRSYQFGGLAGDRLLLRVNRVSGDLCPYLMVKDPNGTVAAAHYRVQGDTTYHRSWIADSLPSTSGFYEISVMDSSGNGTGAFYLSLQRSNAPPGAQRCVPQNTAGYLGICRDTIRVTVSLPTQMRPFFFYGGTNRAVTIVAQRDSGGLRPVVEVFRPDGRSLVRGGWTGSDTTHASTLIPTTILGENKDFFFLVSDHSGDAVGQCALMITITQATSVEERPAQTTEEMPSAFALCQNYPNPFNPSTAIEYHVPRSSFVTLTVYDLIGRSVATLVNAVREPGRHRAMLDGTHLASGVYLCVMRSGDFMDTKRLTLLK
jgi:hypothetical protein